MTYRIITGSGAVALTTSDRETAEHTAEALGGRICKAA